jgi:hypothetical protein
MEGGAKDIQPGIFSFLQKRASGIRTVSNVDYICTNNCWAQGTAEK